jgi:hypothetical protein
VSPFLASIKLVKKRAVYIIATSQDISGNIGPHGKEKFTHYFFDMTLRSLISILTLSFASFSAMSFQLPASMISMNSAFAESPAKSALFHQETACALAHSRSIPEVEGNPVSVGRHEPPRRGLLCTDAAPVQRCGES